MLKPAPARCQEQVVLRDVLDRTEFFDGRNKPVRYRFGAVYANTG